MLRLPLRATSSASLLGLGRARTSPAKGQLFQQAVRGLVGDYGAPHEKPFDKILIANRGEIACRIMRTARRLGVKTVAIYSDVDSSSQHVKMADEAYCIGTASSKDSYLRQDRILEVAKNSGAQAIHPGYGFLSENAEFVRKVEAAGIAFVGPSTEPMDAMGDKIHSKKVAKDANCFIIPGFDGEVKSEDDAVRIATEVGFPIMIKASAGGGGKGMRVAYNEEQTREGYRLSKAEAASSFGDDRMLLERFIENPHHIEIQVVADSHGNVVAFPERECSVQRRNQKVVEESPSCLLTPETRLAMQQQAIMLCKATNYRSAGTIEMLADDQQNFYFLEMNTRLQVEHPITELVSGEDIVEHMLWIAAGKKLPERLRAPALPNGAIPFNGHAIESRVYAEDPTRNFLPSIGPLLTYKEPAQRLPQGQDGYTVRIDTGVFEGGTISMHYDPLISKLCTHAPTRSEAIYRMEKAIDDYAVEGLVNNLAFLRAVYRNKKFRNGHYSTKFIKEEFPDGFHGVQLGPREKSQVIATVAAISYLANQVHPPIDYEDEGSDASALTEAVVLLNGPKGDAYKTQLQLNENGHLEIAVTPEKGGETQIVFLAGMDWKEGHPLAQVSFLEKSEEIEDEGSNDYCPPDHNLVVDTTGAVVRQRTVQYFGKNKSGEGFHLRYKGSDQEVIVRTPLEHELNKYMLAPEVKDFSKFVLCPMPGTLISCSVSEGQRVEVGQQLAVVEAMKMQNVLRAEKSGVVKKVRKLAGSHLKVDEVIVEFE